MISQLPATVKLFRALGVRAEVNHLAFEPAILDALPAAPAPDVDVSFVGSVSLDHRQRIALLEAVAERYDLKLWGNRPQALPASSPLHRCFQGEVWGADMYQVLRRSRITLNSHIDLAGREAGNMRLFEATGVGTFLLTDFKDNLHTLFAPDREVAVWRSIEECVKQIEHYLARRRRPRRDRARRPGEDHGAAHLSPSRRRNSRFRRGSASAAMKLPRIVRQIGKRVVKATPILRRHILPSTRLSRARRHRGSARA